MTHYSTLFTPPIPVLWLHGSPRDVSIRLYGEVHIWAVRRFTQPIRLLQVWDSLPPPPHCPAQGGVGWRGKVTPHPTNWSSSHTHPFTILIHTFVVRHQILETHTCLLTLTLRGCNMDQGRIHGRNTHSHTFSHQSRRPGSQHLTHVDSCLILLPRHRCTSSLFTFYYSTYESKLLAQHTN